MIRTLARTSLATACLVLLAGGAAAHADDDLRQTIDRNQKTVSGPATATRGHVDIGPRLAEDDWSLQIHDDTVTPSVWRHPNDVVVTVPDVSIQQVPDNSDYGFLGVQPDGKVHILPQTQDPDVPWLGWNTQDPDVMDAVNLGATLTLRGVQGPGEVVVYLQSGNLGKPKQLWSSTAKGAQKLWLDVNTHTHANWVFTKPGVYLLDLGVSAELKSGKKVDTHEYLRFAVGDATTADAARQASYDASNSVVVGDGEGEEQAGEAKPAEADGSDLPMGWLVGGGVVLVGAAVALLAIRTAGRDRRARREAEALRTGGDA